jgi:hypothetical protein
VHLLVDLDLRFEVVTVVLLKIHVCSDVTCCWACGSRHSLGSVLLWHVENYTPSNTASLPKWLKSSILSLVQGSQSSSSWWPGDAVDNTHLPSINTPSSLPYLTQRETSTALFIDGDSAYTGPYFTREQSLVSSQYYSAALLASVNVKITEFYTTFIYQMIIQPIPHEVDCTLLDSDQALMMEFWWTHACARTRKCFINKIYASSQLLRTKLSKSFMLNSVTSY